jgi:hypothetical protein
VNIALPALVVFVLLLPGFIARSRIKLAERLSLDYSPFGQVATEAVMWAAALHAIWLAGTWLWTGRVLRADLPLRLLSADAGTQARALDALAAEAGSVALYFGTLVALAYIVPAIIRSLIQHFRLDRAGSPLARFLRFSAAPWYYLLSGADFRREDTPDCIAISAIVSVAGKSVLYTGILVDYFLDQEGRLDRMILQGVMRRPLEKDKSPGSIDRELDRFYPIDGDYFVLRYAEAITLNVEYIKITPQLEA